MLVSTRTLLSFDEGHDTFYIQRTTSRSIESSLWPRVVFPCSGITESFFRVCVLLAVVLEHAESAFRFHGNYFDGRVFSSVLPLCA